MAADGKPVKLGKGEVGQAIITSDDKPTLTIGTGK